MASLVLLCILTGSVRAEPLPDAPTLRKWIEAMKTAPRGPFKHIRHYCADGAVIPPSENCDDAHGGGQVEHGEWTDQVVSLRQNGYEIANIYAIVKPERFIGPAADLKALRQMLAERYLIGIDDGWVMRVTRSYRGSIQAEDEGKGAARLIAALIDDPLWRADGRYFLLREAVRLLPGSPDAGEKAASAAEVRDRAIKLSERDPAFFPIRVKIHNVPDSGDAAAVRAFAKAPTKPELADDYEELAKRIEELYSTSSAPEKMRALARVLPGTRLALDLDLDAGTLEGTKVPERQFAEASRWLVRLRREAPVLRDRAAVLALLEASLALEETAYASGNEMAKTVASATRRQRLEKIAQAGDALAGSGLVNLRHADGLRASVARLLAADPAVDSYREEVRYLARPPEWAAATFRLHLQEGVDSLLPIEPRVHSYPQDRLRGSPLLFYASLADGLVNDASLEAGITHQIFGKNRGTGLRALNPGLARGTIRVPNDATQIGKFDRQGIYLLPHTIAELTPVAGILTQGEGNSLSHVQLLARNLGIPNVIVGGEVLDAIRSRGGKKSVLAVSPNGVVVLDEDGASWNEVFGKQKVDPGVQIRPDIPKLDLTATKFVGLEDLRAGDAGRISGPKGANLGELKNAFGAQVPDGVVIPFGVFRKLLEQPIEAGGPTVFAWMQRQYRSLAKLPERKKAEAVKALLARLRQWALNVDPGEGFRTELRGALEKLAPKGGGVFVRSDTNIEDLAGFTGAGLNLTVPNVVGEEAVFKAIREVWASPFSDRSFAWRQSFMNQPEYVFPAVLLQAAFPSEKSGVMVSTDIEGGREGFLSIAVNEGVGGAVDGQAAESLLVSKDGKDVRYLAQATAPLRNELSPQGGVTKVAASGTDTVLQPGEIAQLVTLAREAPQRFPLLRGDDGTPRAADVEFGFAGGKIALLQIRPVNENRRARESTYLRSLDARISGDGARKIPLDAVPKRGS